MTSTTYSSEGQPWLSVGMLAIAGLLLIATRFTNEAHTVARFVIVGLWVLTALVAVIKESAPYGAGDRLTVMGMVLIFVLTSIVGILDFAHTGKYSLLSITSVLLAGFMLVKALTNVYARRRAVLETRS